MRSLWPRFLRKKRRRSRKAARSSQNALSVALFTGLCLLATVGWLAAQVHTLRRELGALHHTEGPAGSAQDRGTIVAEMVHKAAMTQESVARHASAIDALRAAIQNDPTVLVDRMILPTVRLDLAESSGSGTVIHVRPFRPAPEAPGPSETLARVEWEVFALTAYHVIQEALEAEGGAMTVSVEFFDRTGEVCQKAQAEIYRHDEARDLALLRMVLADEPPACAVLASRPALGRIRTFNPVYTVGCPLGLAPLPSKGEITNTNRKIDGQIFWMTDAQMIFGNSGGGIYDARNQEMIGVSSRVCAYGRVLPAAVPHLGVMVSMGTVLDWFEEKNLAFLAGAAEVDPAVLPAGAKERTK